MTKINLARSKYNWLTSVSLDLDPGTAHIARKGKEFTCQPQSFAGVLYKVAGEYGYRATVAVFTEDNTVVFSFFRPDAMMRPNLAAYPVVKKMRRRIERRGA